MISARHAATMLFVTLISATSLMPDNRGFSRAFAIWVACDASRAYSVTARPARAATAASAVPHAPAPMMPIELRGMATPQLVAMLLPQRRYDSLPPCGGGLGRGVVQCETAVVHPHPRPLPARGRGAHRASGDRLAS